jgi:hypothetical protein
MRASEFITETWPVAVAKWFDILRKSQKFKHLPDDKIQQMATRAAQKEVAPAQKAATPKQSMKDRFNQHRQEMSDEEFQDYYGFGKWDNNIAEGLSSIDKQFLDMVGAEVEEQEDIGDYSLYVIHTPSFDFGEMSFPEAHQLAINKRNIAFTDPALQHEKFVRKGERFPLGSIGQLKNTVSKWIKRYGPLLVVSDSESKQKTYEKLLNRLGFNMERTTYQMQPGVYVSENFADGKVKGKSRPGRFKRAGVSCKGSVTDLRKKAKNSSGEKQKGYHFCANMKSGKKK